MSEEGWKYQWRSARFGLSKRQAQALWWVRAVVAEGLDCQATPNHFRGQKWLRSLSFVVGHGLNMGMLFGQSVHIKQTCSHGHSLRRHVLAPWLALQSYTAPRSARQKWLPSCFAERLQHQEPHSHCSVQGSQLHCHHQTSGGQRLCPGNKAQDKVAARKLQVDT